MEVRFFVQRHLYFGGDNLKFVLHSQPQFNAWENLVCIFQDPVLLWLQTVPTVRSCRSIYVFERGRHMSSSRRRGQGTRANMRTSQNPPVFPVSVSYFWLCFQKHLTKNEARESCQFLRKRPSGPGGGQGAYVSRSFLPRGPWVNLVFIFEAFFPRILSSLQAHHHHESLPRC